MKLKDIKPNPNNPRVLRDDKFQKLKQSIAEFPKMLSLRPMVIDENNVVLGGNMRLRALQELGFNDIDEAWVKRSSDLTEEEKKRFIIADNVAFGEWDWDTLANDWEVVDLEAWGLDIPQFDTVEELEASEDDYEVPEGGIETDIVIGDLFEIGEHRLLCGDSTDSDAVARLMNGEKSDLLLTDPPYSSGGNQESGKTSGSIGARGGHTIKNDNLSTRGYRLLMQDVLSLCSDVHSIFIFCDWKMWIETFDISERSGFRVRNMIVWDKMQMGMGMPFRNQHELCLFASKIAGKIGDGATPNVLQHKRDREAEHKTPKPIELLSDLLKQIESTNVFDPFLGGGSTMVAAHQLKRKCYGMELEPKYCQVIIDRMRKLDSSLIIKRNGIEIKTTK
jgi:DNA modification methylase